MHRMPCFYLILGFLLCCTAIVLATPYQVLRVTESFLGSNADGSMFYTLKETSDNCGSHYSHEEKKILRKHTIGKDGKFGLEETPIFEHNTSSDADYHERISLRVAHPEVEENDLCSSSTVVQFFLTDRGLMVEAGEKTALLYDKNQIKERFGLEYRPLTERHYIPSHKSRNYYFTEVLYGWIHDSAIRHSAVLPIPVKDVNSAFRREF